MDSKLIIPQIVIYPQPSTWFIILYLLSTARHILPLNSLGLPPSTMQHFGKGALRVAKNYTKGYSDTQAKVRDATSNDPWGPSGTQMNEIAQMTYNQCAPSQS